MRPSSRWRSRRGRTGTSTASTSGTSSAGPRRAGAARTSELLPPEHPLLDRVDECLDQGEHEEDDGDDAADPERLAVDRPGEDEDCFDVEDDEEQAEDVVAHVGLRPAGPDRVDTALVCHLLGRGGVVRPDERGDSEYGENQDDADRGEYAHRDVVLEVLGHPSPALGGD